MTLHHSIFCVAAVALASCLSRNTADASSHPVPAVDSTTSAKSTYGTICLDSDAQAWADSVIATLTLDQRIAQLFVPRLDISYNAEGRRQIQSVIDKCEMGGILLGKASLSAYVKLLDYARSKARVPLLVTFDGEWGLSMRIPQAPRFPYAMALGAARSTELMLRYGREMARECSLLGVQVNFAPVLDVNINPANPVIGYRSFGGDPAIVGALGAAYCRGMAEGGVLAVGKHFPGHGDTSLDSHKALPAITHRRDILMQSDILPFRICIIDGMQSVMTGHLSVPALDPSGAPASLSSIITEGLLRDSLDFQGLIFTDALAMKGAALPYGNNCVNALRAGAHLLLGSSSPESDLRAVRAAVADGTISPDTIYNRCRKVLMYKYALQSSTPPISDVSTLQSQLDSPQCRELISEMCSAAVTCLRDSAGILPLADSPSTVVIAIGDIGDFSSEVRRILPQAKLFTVSKTAKLSPSALAALRQSHSALIALSTDVSWAINACREALNSSPDAGIIYLGNAYKLASLPFLDKVKTLLVTYDYFPAMGRAAAKAVTGCSRISGRMPVDVPNIAVIGEGIDL